MKIYPIGHLLKTNPIKACPERIEFTLSVIEGNGPISNAGKRTKEAKKKKRV
ncbi:unnamed protein product, partial [marine sediment metagenome]